MGKDYDTAWNMVEKLASVPVPLEVALEAVEDAQIAASLELNGLSKLSREDRPYRDRVEVFPVRGDKVLGGKYPDGSFAAFGGGIDGKQRPETAGKREVQEESGRRVEKVKRLPVPDTAYDWDPRSENHPGMSAEQKEKIRKRIEEFRGQKTTYLIADLPVQRPQKRTDETSIKNVKMYPIEEAIGMQEQAAKKARGRKREIAEGRLDALEAVRDIVEGVQTKEAAKLRTELLPHQQRVIDRIASSSGLVVAHGTGSGKTLSSIAAAVELKPKSIQVVVPAALKDNYQKEIDKHVEGDFPVAIDSIQRLAGQGEIPKSDLLIIDEAHRARNPKSKSYSTLSNAEAEKRLLLTASPVYNKPEDIAPLVNLAAGDRVLPTGTDFDRRYIKKPSQGLFSLLPFTQKEPIVIRKEELGPILRKWVDYHRGQEEGFPSKTEVAINTPMSRDQTYLHDKAWGKMPFLLRARLRRGLPPSKADIQALNAFQSQTRQVSTTMTPFSQYEVGLTPKLQAAVRNFDHLLKRNPDRHKAVIYSNFLAGIQDYSKELKSRNIPHAVFTGKQTEKERKRIIDDYNNDRIKALLVSSAGGEGLDLKGTRQVQILEPHWNDEKIQQVVGRAARHQSHAHLPKEEQNVKVETYLTSPRGAIFGTNTGVEDVLYGLSKQKKNLAADVVSMIDQRQKAASLNAVDEIVKEAREAKIREGEFAPGIPAERGIYPIPEVKEDDQNQTWTASLSKHPAIRRGTHLDLRLIDPQGRAHSWAFQDMPEPGKNSYAVQMPTHKKRYALRDQPFSIPEGYGATRPGEKVEPLYVRGVEVIEASDKNIRLIKHDGQQSEEITMKRVMPALSAKQPPLWVINNATKNRSTGEGQRIPAGKPTYKEIDPDQVDFNDPSEVMTPKIDGAHVLVDMARDQKFMRVYSYRPTARKTGLIEHTFKFPDFQNRKSDDSVNNTMVRAELWGSREGKAIPAEELAGLLNSGVEKSRREQKERGVTLRLSAIDVIRHGGKNYENKPFADKLEVLHAVRKGTKGLIEIPPMAATPDEKVAMLKTIKEGKLPMTKEGVVLHDITSSKMTKVKFKPDHDVYVRRIFTKPQGRAKGHAGGFSFSWTPDGPEVGRVGTGFSHEMKADMLKSPDKYVGRVATVNSQGAYANKTDASQRGALRAPAFRRWHLDKNDPEQMQKEGAFFHGSPKKLMKLEPRADHNDDRIPPNVFAATTKSLAKTYAGRPWSDKDFEQSTQLVGDTRKIVMQEMRPGAIEDVFEGAKGHVYHLSEEGFESPPAAKKRTMLEVINSESVTPKKDEVITDTLKALKADPNVEFQPYDPDHSRVREGLRRAVKRMQGMPDKGKSYKKWRLTGAPDAIVKMFAEEERRVARGE